MLITCDSQSKLWRFNKSLKTLTLIFHLQILRLQVFATLIFSFTDAALPVQAGRWVDCTERFVLRLGGAASQQNRSFCTNPLGNRWEGTWTITRLLSANPPKNTSWQLLRTHIMITYVLCSNRASQQKNPIFNTYSGWQPVMTHIVPLLRRINKNFHYGSWIIWGWTSTQVITYSGCQALRWPYAQVIRCLSDQILKRPGAEVDECHKTRMSRPPRSWGLEDPLAFNFVYFTDMVSTEHLCSSLCLALYSAQLILLDFSGQKVKQQI